MTIDDMKRAILELPAEEKQKLWAALGRIARNAVRCPSRDTRTGERCVRDEGHDTQHIGEDGAEWLVALRCQLLAGCSRIDGHEGACVPEVRPESTTPPAPAVSWSAKAPWGQCVCGAPKREHDKAGLGGCASTGCTAYRKRERKAGA